MRYTSLAPADFAASITALSSTGVTPEGTPNYNSRLRFNIPLPTFS